MSFKQLFSYIIPLLLIASLAGCDLVSKSELNQETDSELYNLYAQFVERHDEDKGLKLYLNLITKEQFGCYNYRLLTEQIDSESNDYRLALEVTGATLPGNACATALGPARAFIPFENRVGIKELKVKNGHRSDLLTVNVTSETASVELEEGTFIEVVEPELYRTPRHSMHSRCRMTNDTSQLCENWFEKLESEPYTERFEFTENVRITYPRNRDDSPSEYRYFKYGSEENYEKIKDLFTEFVIRHSEIATQLNPGIQNWKGEFLIPNMILD